MPFIPEPPLESGGSIDWNLASPSGGLNMGLLLFLLLGTACAGVWVGGVAGKLPWLR